MEGATCRTFVKKYEYLDTWNINDLAIFRYFPVLTSPVFSGSNPSGQRMNWNYVLEIKHGSFCLKVQSKSFGSNKQVVEIGLETSPRVTENYKKYCGFLSDFTITEFSFYGTILHFYVKISLVDNPSEKNFSMEPELPLSNLADNFANLLLNKNFTDLTITVGSEAFRAHKAILVARSTIFAAMFQADMQESQRNEIIITDMEPSVFKQVLRFIYTDKVEGLPKMACELLAAADKYDLARLQVMCEIALFEGITVESAIKTLLFADLHRAEKLKARTIQFIGEHLKAIPNLGQFCSSRSDLAAEILSAIAASK